MMKDRYIKSKMSVEDFLSEEIGLIKGAPYFIDKVLEVLDEIKMTDEKIVWWVGMFCNYHNYEDFNYGSLQKTRAHFKNLSRRYLDESNTQFFLNWERNWAVLTMVCKKMDIELLNSDFIDV